MSQQTTPCFWCRWLPVFVIGLVVGVAVLTVIVSKIPSQNLPLLVASPNPVEKWVPFKESELGIEFRYPPNWSVEHTPEFLNILDENRQLVISIEPNVSTSELTSVDCSNSVGKNCEIAHYNSLIFEINWGESEGALPTAFTRQSQSTGVRITLLAPTAENNSVFRNFLPTFVFSDSEL